MRILQGLFVSLLMGGGGEQLAKFSYGFILSPQIDFEYFVSHHHVLKLVHHSSRINDKFSKYVI